MANAAGQVGMPSLEVVRAALAIVHSKLKTYYPDEGLFARSKYPKHLKFFRATTEFNEVCFMAGNRVGKTCAGGFASAVWLTGRYPKWWEGRRFDGPIKMWACGDTGHTVKNILQEQLLGSPVSPGSGFIPPADVYYTTPKIGIPEAVGTAYVRHQSGGISECTLKSYDQRRESFQGTAIDLIWDDEEPPLDIYDEQMMRLVTTGGLMILTMTPLQGLTSLVSQYMAESPVASI
jgi:phage terminase large subunit-like protein